MKIQIAVSLCALLLGACTNSTERSISNTAANAGDEMPLRCVECSFVENKSGRRIVGRIQNNLKIALEEMVLRIEFKDSKGNVLARQDNMPLFGGRAIEPGTSNQFAITVTDNQSSITQATVHLERASTAEPLSAPITLLLVVALDSSLVSK